jgi:hypothetical protein
MHATPMELQRAAFVELFLLRSDRHLKTVVTARTTDFAFFDDLIEFTHRFFPAADCATATVKQFPDER